MYILFLNFQLESFDEDMKYIQSKIEKRKDLKENHNVKILKYWLALNKSNNSTTELPKKDNKIEMNLKLHTSKGKSTNEVAREYYEALSEKDRQKIYEAYYFDYLLFNYTKDGFI